MDKKIAQEHICIFSFMVAAMAIGLLYICNFWIFKSDSKLSYDLNRILAYLVPVIFVFIVCLFSENINKIEFHPNVARILPLLKWRGIAICR